MSSLSPSPCLAASPIITVGSTTGFYTTPSSTLKLSFGTPTIPYSTPNERYEGVSRPLAYAKISPRPLHQGMASTPPSQAPAGLSSPRTLTQYNPIPLSPFGQSFGLRRLTSASDRQSQTCPEPSLVPSPSVYPNESLVQHPASIQSYSQMAHQPEAFIRPSSAAWNLQDDQTLMAARAQGMNWAPIQSAYFPNKTPNACRKRHERLMERRSTGDWDGIKLENSAKHYMAMRREIWAPLAAQTGQKWNVVEQKCMSLGLKNLQTIARSCARRERLMDTDSGYSSNIHLSIEAGAFENHDDDSGYIDEIEAEYDADGAGLPKDEKEAESNKNLGMHSRDMYRSRLPSVDMGIDAIINRPAGDVNGGYSHRINHSSATATSISSHTRMTDNPSDAATSILSQSRMTAISSESILSNEPTGSTSYSYPTYPSSSNQLDDPSAVRQGHGQLPTTPGSLQEVVPAFIKLEKEDTNISVHVDAHNVTQISIHEPPVSRDPSAPPDPHQTSQMSCQRDSDDLQEAQESSDDDHSLVSWEDQTSFKDGTIPSPAARRQFDTVMSLSAALRYRLMSQLMLAFHLRCKQSPTATHPNCNTDTPPTDGTTTDTTPGNTASGNSSTPSGSFTASGNPGGITSPSDARRISHKHGAGEGDEEDEGMNKKRPRHDPPDYSSFLAKRGEFICPYRHREPRSFGLSAKDVCARTWPDIAKLKEHLYRKHFHKFQCQRCKANIKSRFELDQHAEGTRACHPRSRQLTDGFTFEIYEMLHNKKKSFLGQNDQGRWQEIYELLFYSEGSISGHDFDCKNPNDPSPVTETKSNPGYRNLNLLENYEPYAEALVATRMRPIETHLLGQVLSPNYQSEDKTSKNPQDLPTPSIQEQDCRQNELHALFAVSGSESHYATLPSSDNQQTVNDTHMMDFQTSSTDQTDYDAQLNTYFSQYASLPSLPAQSSPNHDISFNPYPDFCSKCEGYCTCQTRIDFEAVAPLRQSEQSVELSTLANTNIIQQLLERIEALEKKQ